MAEAFTNKELLQLIVEQQKDMAKKQYDFAAEVSTFINKQTQINDEQVKLNSKFVNYLENDNSTNQVGVVQRAIDNEKRIDRLETNQKITAGKISILIAAATIVGTITFKVFEVFKS